MNGRSVGSRTGTADHGAERSRRWVVYTGWGLVFVALLTVMLVMFGNRQANREVSDAQDLAAQLNQALGQAGLGTLDEDTVVQVLGADGGAVCADPGAALGTAEQRITSGSGAAGPGARPSLTASDAIQAEGIVIDVYCPDERAAFDEYVDSLNLEGRTTFSGAGDA